MVDGVLERDGRYVVPYTGDDGRAHEKTFGSEGRAKAWKANHDRVRASRIGAKRADPAYSGDVTKATLGHLLKRYAREVSVTKRGASEEAYRIARLAERSIAGIKVGKITSKDIADYRNERLLEVGNSSVRSELSLIRRSLEVARREWGFELAKNAAGLVTLPKPSQARSRRLEAGEYEKLEKALKEEHPLVWSFVRLAIETACRRGELLGLTWRNVDLSRRMIFLSMTKNGEPRTVPLSEGAVEILEAMRSTGEKVFPIDQHALRWAWNKACKDQLIKDLRLHDLRHEGVSRLFEEGLSVPHVALISGHKTLNMLQRYTQLRPTDLVEKLRGKRLGRPLKRERGGG